MKISNILFACCGGIFTNSKRPQAIQETQIIKEEIKEKEIAPKTTFIKTPHTRSAPR